MNVETIINVVVALVALLIGSGGGLLFADSQKKKEKASAKQAVTDADVAEARAFAARITILSEQLEKSADQVRLLTDKVEELTAICESLKRENDQLKNP